MIDPYHIPAVEFTEPVTLRLIATAYIREPAMEPLVEDPADLSRLRKSKG